MEQVEFTLFLESIWALVVGAGLGFLYYGGLWWTIRRLPRTSHPGSLFMASFALRTVTVLAGLFLVTGGAWMPLAAAMIGFLTIRFILVRNWGPEAMEPGESAARRRNHGAQS